MTAVRRVVTIGATPDEVAERWQAAGVQQRVWAHAPELAGVGTLRAHPAPRALGSEVSLTAETTAGGHLPAGLTGATVFEALRRFKALVEAGEIPTLDRNPHARHSGPDPH